MAGKHFTVGSVDGQNHLTDPSDRINKEESSEQSVLQFLEGQEKGGLSRAFSISRQLPSHLLTVSDERAAKEYSSGFF